MADTTSNGSPSFSEPALRLKLGLAEMLKGGVIMDVMNVEQARIAEEAGATSVMALERVPAMIRAEGGVARMANPKLIRQIIAAVSIPSWPRPASATSPRRRYFSTWASTSSTSPKSSPPPTRLTTSTSTPSPRPSSAERATWERPCAASPRVQP